MYSKSNYQTMKTSVHQRFEIMISSLGLTRNSFAIAIKVAPTQIYNIANGRNAPSFEMLQKIGSRFPEVNLDWLIVDRGQPLKTQPQIQKDDLIKRLELLEATMNSSKEIDGKIVDEKQMKWRVLPAGVNKSKKKNPTRR